MIIQQHRVLTGWRMPGLLRLVVLLAVVTALFATRLPSALAQDNSFLTLHLQGSSPSYSFTLANPATYEFNYVYTNQGTGAMQLLHGDAIAAGRGNTTNSQKDPQKPVPVNFSYKENGTFNPTALSGASYTITPQSGPAAKLGLVFDVIPSSYTDSYTNPADAPCSNGTFSYSLKLHGAQGAANQGPDAVAHGTFAPQPGTLVIIPGAVELPCIPTASIDLVIMPGSHADQALRKGKN